MRRVGAVVLAAGASSRLGEPKQLALLAGETLLARAVRIAQEAGCDPVVVVLGARASEVQAQCSLGSTRVLVNERWQEGMASSIRAGVASLVREVDGLIVMTCDQPAVTAHHLRRLIARDPNRKTASSYGGLRGVPVYFPAHDLDAGLLILVGDKGARGLVMDAESIELLGGELDIDTQESLALARARYKDAMDERP